MMANDNGPTIRDVILKKYELTDKYHDAKAYSAWLVSAAYFGFSIGFIMYWSKTCDSWLNLGVSVFCFAVFSGAMSFANLQFRHRWSSVVQTSMMDWIFRYHWETVLTGGDFTRLQNQHEELVEAQENAGIGKGRRGLEIVTIAITYPFALLVHFLFMLFICRKQRQNAAAKMREVDHIQSTCYFRTLTDKQKRELRCTRRIVSGLIDTRYRTEIPAYTISLYFFITQILFIWCPKIG